MKRTRPDIITLMAVSLLAVVLAGCSTQNSHPCHAKTKPVVYGGHWTDIRLEPADPKP